LTHLQRGFAQDAATQADRGGQDFASSALNVPGGWQQRTQRSGVIAVKVGMTQEWDSWGARIPLTVLWIDNCQARYLALHVLLKCIMWKMLVAINGSDGVWDHSGGASEKGREGGLHSVAARLWR